MLATIGLILVAVLSAILALLYARYRKWVRQYPTRNSSFLTGNFGHFVKTVNENKTLEAALVDGFETTQIVLPLGLARIVVVADPDWVEHVTATKNCPKNPLVVTLHYYDDCSIIV
jgi:hypothetical protein